MPKKTQPPPPPLIERLIALTDDEPEIPAVLEVLDETIDTLERSSNELSELQREHEELKKQFETDSIRIAELELHNDDLHRVYDTLELEYDEEGLLLQTLQEMKKGVANLAQLEERALDLQATLDERREKLITEIIGLWELAGKDTTAIERFKQRAEKMTWDELDAEHEEAKEAAKEAFGTPTRTTTEHTHTADQLTLNRLADYRL